MDNLKVGNIFTMAYPFHKYESLIPNKASWSRGCIVETEEYGDGYGERFFTAHGEGKIVCEVLSIAKMPNKFMDRVLFKRTTIDPDGNKCGKSEVRTLTTGLFMRDINSRTPFKVDYEIEALPIYKKLKIFNGPIK